MKKAEQMRPAVQQWKASGLTQKAYCEKIGIKRSTFANWVKRSKEQSGNGFMAIAPPVEPAPEPAELIYPNGVKLKVSTGDISLLSDLIRIF